MEDTRDIGRFLVGGYSFYTEKDAALAESELRKVKYLEERLNYDKPDNILKIYNKAIDDNVFKSPVGHFFLKSLQEFLLGRPEIDPGEVKVIPLHVSYGGDFRGQVNPARSRVKPAPEKQTGKSAALPISIILNLVLAAAVIAMFVITLNADQPNILNYEREITNRYASWEQELTQREQMVREKERELNLVPQDTF